LGFSSCPDEEGTERSASVTVLGQGSFVSAVVPMRRELKGGRPQAAPSGHRPVSAVVPMRRELKGAEPDPAGRRGGVSAVVPMRRELKVQKIEVIFG